MPKFEIQIASSAAEELKGIRAFDRRRIVHEIDEQLGDQPAQPTRNRKRLDAVTPDFEHVPPIWELRIGSYRVFYDVDDAATAVYVRAVREKTPSEATKDVIHEGD
jgi:mRNA-degrading endonuclease RelE of RelBE toxin-antitoxin system